MTDQISALPALADQRRLRAELGVTQATADAIFRHVPVIRIPGHRKAFVRIDDVRDLLDRWASGTDPARPVNVAAVRGS